MNEIELDALPTRKARIEIIPLIDVVFFLLATFVLFTLSLEKMGAISVPLPKAGTEGPEDCTVFIQAADHGMFYWKLGKYGTAEPISAAELRPRLEEYRRTTPKPRVLVRGDGKAKFGAAVKVLDEARLARIPEVSMETVPSVTGN
ncbi:MAG: biopolymer transporter ExbD [Opitutaceae bacterium]|nr:biopolymer transporter ExbD [Opitutaceae bacterium]